MNQRIQLIGADPTSFSIDRIYSILWSTISKTSQYVSNRNIFICPHTVEITLNPDGDLIYYQPQRCGLCSQNQIRTIKQMFKYKYMICGILYFLLEGRNNLQQYYETQDLFFFQNIYGYYNENQYFLRSICLILTKQDFLYKQSIIDQMPQSSKPIILQCFQLQQYQVIIISPCLGAPQFRIPESSSVFYLKSFRNLMNELRETQNQIGMNNPLPPPCLHNIFIGLGNQQNYSKFRINFYLTNPICRCQNRQMGTILYTFITGEEYINQNRQDTDQIMDDLLIEFSKKLITKYEFNSAQEQFDQYDQIINEIDEYRISMSTIIENNIDPSFYAHSLKNYLIYVENDYLWEYYKILFLQEMIELLENRILTNPLISNFLCANLLQLKVQQIDRIQSLHNLHSLLEQQNICILQIILQNYTSQLQNQFPEMQQQNSMIENINQLPHVYIVRQILFEKFSQVQSFQHANNQFFRDIFRGDFNYQTIIEFEDQLNNDRIQL